MEDKAVGLELPNNMRPQNYGYINHQHLPVPKPSNHAAKVTHAEEVMRQVREAK
jgi:hypothetical protein